MKKVKIKDAVGLPICHDMTRVVPGKFKGVAFKKGHIIQKEDIEVLEKMGKEHIYIEDIPEGYIHENNCAERIANAIVDKEVFTFTEVREGKINIKSKENGILKINSQLLFELNSIEHISISTKYSDIVVNEGEIVASERIIPLYTSENNIIKVEKLCMEKGPLLYVKKFKYQKVHIIITGNEVYKGLIKDKFEESLVPKVKQYGCEVIKIKKAPDDKDFIKKQIEESLKEGAEIILCTGGMSVDEDDLTPVAIKEIIDKLVVHGAPVQPGNMFLLGYKNNIPILGLPGAVMFFPYTIFDGAFPKIACGEKIKKEYFINLGLGGLCSFCSECKFPNCTFLKGR